MAIEQMELARTQSVLTTLLAPTAGRLKILWRDIIRRSAGRHKALAVRETAALGDRRFVSVIQFESQRFLIGSSPTSITLLAKLPDEFSGAGESNETCGDKN
jgi:flagellar biogenesis protein FliO